MRSITQTEIVIQGLTLAGKKFRPSDWAERLSSVLASFGADHHMNYSPYVRPTTLDGVKCVVVDKRLQQSEPRAYGFLMNFARENELKVIDGEDIAANREGGQ